MYCLIRANAVVASTGIATNSGAFLCLPVKVGTTDRVSATGPTAPLLPNSVHYIYVSIYIILNSRLFMYNLPFDIIDRKIRSPGLQTVVVKRLVDVIGTVVVIFLVDVIVFLVVVESEGSV